jgi:type VI secretion system protein ImpF
MTVTERRDSTGVTFSLLDRLIDLSPSSVSETVVSSWEERREYLDSVCRDLTALLNTRRAEMDFDPTFEEAANSLLSFGILDFTSFNLKNEAEQERVRLSIERSIRQFESRLSRIKVSLDDVDELRPVLRFQISAMLANDAGSEPVEFDVMLHRESRRIAVSRGE